MSYCTNCGKELNEAAKFCDNCGTPIGGKPPKKFDFKCVLSKVTPFIKQNRVVLISVSVALVLIIVLLTILTGGRCDYPNCSENAFSDSDYCYEHKCLRCDRVVSGSSNYCFIHKSSSSGSSSSGSSYSSATLDLRFSNIKIQHNSLYTVVTGTVTNKGSKSYKFVTVKGAFKNSSGTVIDTDSTYAVGSEGLAPGESKTFRMSVDKNYNIKNCSISIISYK